MANDMKKFWGFFFLLMVASAPAVGMKGEAAHPSMAELNQPVTADYAQGPTAFDGRVQVIAFNIERGFFWPDVVKYIETRQAELPATVVLLSECDRNHSRTKEVFVAEQMARTLKMNMAYVTEFIEFNDQTPENQGDHGNAILSPFPLSELTVIRHRRLFSWERHGAGMGEPRFGDRVTLAATVLLPGGRRLRVYSCHLESHADTFRRSGQMAEVLADAMSMDLPTVIGGDFNELPGGMIFLRLPRGMRNVFARDLQPTGACRPGRGKARCILKIDWLLYRNLVLVDSFVDYPLNSEGGVISDHAPVRGIFRLSE